MKDTEKTLALAGIFQSASLVNQIAYGNPINDAAYTASINSIFVLNPNDFSEIYGDPSNLEVGFNMLTDLLNKKNLKESNHTIRYAIGLMHIQSLLSKDADTLAVLRNRLEQCIGRTQYFDSHTHPSVIANLADIYVDTMGTFRYRIQVKGDPAVLQQSDNANKVRAIFLAGVRAAILWNQLGGRRWQLMLSRKRVLDNIERVRA